jgi:hypothetical protein
VGEDLWVNIESWPQNAVMNGEVVYTLQQRVELAERGADV